MHQQQESHKVAEQQARAAEKSGSEYMRLLADAMRHMAATNCGLAEEAFRKAISLKPDEPAAYYNLACYCGNIEGRRAEAMHNFLHAATLFSEGSVEWADSTAAAFTHLLSPECNEVAKPEWWNDEGLKTLSKKVAIATGAADGYRCRVTGHIMRMKVLSGQYPGWQLGPRSAADLNEAATCAGYAAQPCLARKSAQSTTRASALLGMAADLFHKAADTEAIEAEAAAAEAGAKAVVRAEAETKANAAADALLAEEEAEAVAAATRAPNKGKGKTKGKGKSSGKQ